MRFSLLAMSVVLGLVGSPAWSQEPGEPPLGESRVLPEGKLPPDARLKPPRTLNDAYHPWTPPATKEAWEQEAKRIREQVLVSNGLWPMPPSAPLQPVIHGRIERDDYTIDKVIFASLPGHYVTGSLYRPKNTDGKKLPGILCPHGHWANGRFYDAGEAGAKAQREQEAEEFDAGARYPLQARMVHLARMGCVVFHYDMVGYADSQQIPHRAGFTDAQAELWLQNFMGLQTFNSIRALDFILSLPEVDANRIGVTGASGGGTQTFMLGAIDPRVHVVFPAVMVSTGMQGGCICENASYLRIGINNIALAALFAPKPQAMSGADDWTIQIETKGYPELRHVYGLYGQQDLISAKAYPQFKHNYNQVAREMMYAWFNRHLKLNHSEPIEERDFEPVPPAQLSVYDAEHPLAADAVDAAGLRQHLTKISREQFAALLPKDKADVTEYRNVIGTAAGVLLDRGVPAAGELEIETVSDSRSGDVRVLKRLVGRMAGGERIPVVVLVPANYRGEAVLWIEGKGKAALFDHLDERTTEAVRSLLKAGRAVIAPDVFLTGEFVPAGEYPRIVVDERYAGYTFGYNRPVLAERVRDVLTVLAAAGPLAEAKQVDLVGTGAGGVWALLARALAGEQVRRTIVDLQGFHFGRIQKTNDPGLLPGGLRYGGIGGLAALAAPAELTLAGTQGIPEEELRPLTVIYGVTGGTLQLEPAPLTRRGAVERLLK